MRFTKEKRLREAYYNNSTKYVQKFLWWPMTIDGETRWLETADILYRVQYDRTSKLGLDYYYWEPQQFINK